jgi:anti-anti-sigma factor
MTFSTSVEMKGREAWITLDGELDAAVAGEFRQAIEQVAEQKPEKLVLFVSGLQFMASAGLRVLVFAKQQMGREVSIYVVGATRSGPQHPADERLRPVRLRPGKLPLSLGASRSWSCRQGTASQPTWRRYRPSGNWSLRLAARQAWTMQPAIA